VRGNSSRAERYRKLAVKYHELGKFARPAYLGDFYRGVAVRYTFMAQEASERAKREIELRTSKAELLPSTTAMCTSDNLDGITRSRRVATEGVIGSKDRMVPLDQWQPDDETEMTALLDLADSRNEERRSR
jgi:hypothetical protein